MKYGVEASLKTIDVKTANDYQKIFSSEWPFLKIHSKGKVTVDINGSSEIVVETHNLGYVPVFLVWIQSADGTEVEMSGPWLTMDDTKLVFQQADYGGSYEITLFYYIFRHDLMETFHAPFISENTKKSSNSALSDIGIKMTVKGKDVKSKDPRDFVIHSSFKTLPIHMQGHGSQNVGAFPSSLDVTIYHNVGYAPLTFFFLKAPGATKWQAVQTFIGGYVTMDSVKSRLLFLLAEGTWEYAYIIFKDPLTIGG